MPTSEPVNPLMAPPIALPATKAIRVSAGWMSTDDAMIFGETNGYTTCWMMMVPTSATNAIHGLTNTPTSAASAPPSHGPTMGMMFKMPAMMPSAA